MFLGHRGVQALPTYIVNSWRPDEDVMPSKVNGCMETSACRCSGDSKPTSRSYLNECTETGHGWVCVLWVSFPVFGAAIVGMAFHQVDAGGLGCLWDSLGTCLMLAGPVVRGH